MPTPLSVVIITLNEEQHIQRCIESVKGISDDIIVVDDFSSDRTPEICRSLGVQFVQKEWEGYGLNKNHGNDLAQHDWVLSIDADEALSPELATNIQAVLQNPTEVAFDLPFMTNYCGQWIKHGRWFPEFHIRLFHRHKVKWNTDDVHEGLMLPPGGKVTRLKGFVHHYTIDSIQSHIQKVNHYSSLAADKMFKKGRKASFVKLYLNPPSKFVIDYFFRMGFLDGFHGLCIAAITSFETFLKYAKLRALWRGK